MLNIVDDVTPEGRRAAADTSISGRRVVREPTGLIAERGVSAAQGGRDLDVHETVLRTWMRHPMTACSPASILNHNQPSIRSPRFKNHVKRPSFEFGAGPNSY